MFKKVRENALKDANPMDARKKRARPWHGSRFDVKSGKVVGGPAEKPVKQYKVQVNGEDIEVTE